MKHESHYERTGKLCRKIDVYVVTSTRPIRLAYKHSTQWYRTCREAKESAARHYGLPVDSLRAYFDPEGKR